jgi:hypothetical protein
VKELSKLRIILQSYLNNTSIFFHISCNLPLASYTHIRYCVILSYSVFCHRFQVFDVEGVKERIPNVLTCLLYSLHCLFHISFFTSLLFCNRNFFLLHITFLSVLHNIYTHYNNNTQILQQEKSSLCILILISASVPREQGRV